MKNFSHTKEDIFREYHGKVLGYLRAKVNHAETAEDLASEVFVKIYERIDSFDETKASLSTWIFTITRNTLIDHYRTNRTWDEIPETMKDDFSVEEEVCRTEMLSLLATALESLDTRERDIIILRFYKGQSLTEIARQMQISYSYAKVLQNRAFSVIRNTMDSHRNITLF